MKKSLSILLVLCILLLCSCNRTPKPDEGVADDAVLETDTSTLHSGIIPKGGRYFQGIVYITGEETGNYTVHLELGKEYKEGEAFPPLLGERTNETLAYSEYYIYGDYIYDTADTPTRTDKEWSVSVLDTTKETYGDMLSEVNGVPVSRLDYAFEGCDNLVETPRLSDNATTMIGTFSHCPSLLKINDLPDKVEDICNAFEYCDELKEFPTIPESVKFMSEAFQKCGKVSGECIIPQNVVSIDNAFNCSCISSLVITSDSVKKYTKSLCYVQNEIKISGSCSTELKEKIANSSAARGKITIE